MRLAVSLALLALAGCVRATTVPASPCGVDKAAAFVGQVASAEVRGEVAKAVGHDRIRWIAPDTVVTMDFSESRLNMMLDAANRITDAKCG